MFVRIVAFLKNTSRLALVFGNGQKEKLVKIFQKIPMNMYSKKWLSLVEYKAVLFLLSPFFIFTACSKDKTPAPRLPNESYLFVAHTRLAKNPNIQPKVAQIDFNKFDMLWLGGDLANSTSSDDQTMEHLDSIFDLGNENTLLALGNHDIFDLDRIRKFTGRPVNYSLNRNGLCIVVLNTQENNSEIIGPQKEFLDQVLDTIETSSHLVIMSHKLFWLTDHPEMKHLLEVVPNRGAGSRHCSECHHSNNFMTDFYPRLVEIERQGIKVIMVAGDLGRYVAEYEHTDAEGILFLAAGVSNFDNVEDKVLEFIYDPNNQEFNYQFRNVEYLIQ